MVWDSEKQWRIERKLRDLVDEMIDTSVVHWLVVKRHPNMDSIKPYIIDAVQDIIHPYFNVCPPTKEDFLRGTKPFDDKGRRYIRKIAKQQVDRITTKK